MKINFKYIILTSLAPLCLLPNLWAQTGTNYTVRDFEVWTAAKVKFEATKKLDFSFEEQFRFKDDASTIDQYFSELYGSYDITKKFKIALAARYIRENDNVGKKQGYENHFRWNADLNYKHKIDRFTMKYRLSYQAKDELNVSELQGDFIDNTLRFRAGVAYNIKKWDFDPEFAAEIFNGINNSEGFNKIRLTLGTEYKFKEAGEIGAFYRYEKQLIGDYPKTSNILGIQYQYTIKPKRDDK